MNYETKRKVFETIADKCAGYNDELYKELLIKYDDAFPDNLPVIPKEVGEILQSAQGQDNLLGVLETAKNGHKVSEPLEWIIANQDIFARAWLDGYTVED